MNWNMSGDPWSVIKFRKLKVMKHEAWFSYASNTTKGKVAMYAASCSKSSKFID